MMQRTQLHAPLCEAQLSGAADGEQLPSALVHDDRAPSSPIEAESLRRYSELERRLTALAAAAPVVLCTFRRNADGSYCMPYAAPSITAVYGVSPDDVVEDAGPLFARIDADDVERVRASVDRSAVSMAVWHELFRVHHPMRGVLCVEGHSVPVREADGGVLWHGYVADVTARVELESRVRHSQKMEAIGLLAGGIAHDFNNLLTVIGSSASLLRADLAPGDGRVELLDELQGAYDRAVSLTRQLLVFSRKEPSTPRLIDPDEVLRATRRLLLRVIGEDVRLDVAFGAGRCRLLMDPGQLEQVVLNLAVNARDAMPRGGVLTVSSSRVVRAPSALGPGAWYRLVVEDTGCGMTADVRARAFEPFFTTKGAGRGTGLGLATVYGIVTAQGGSVELRSEPGAGARFEVELPLVETAASPQVSAAPAEVVACEGETVLLVEDDDGVRRVARGALEAHGFRVLEASSAPEALARVAACDEAIHLVLTDVVMPAMSGPDLVTALRVARPRIAVLYMSGHVVDALRPHIEGAGAAYLQKPFTPRKLVARVREALEAGRG